MISMLIGSKIDNSKNIEWKNLLEIVDVTLLTTLSPLIDGLMYV